MIFSLLGKETEEQIFFYRNFFNISLLKTLINGESIVKHTKFANEIN